MAAAPPGAAHALKCPCYECTAKRVAVMSADVEELEKDLLSVDHVNKQLKADIDELKEKLKAATARAAGYGATVNAHANKIAQLEELVAKRDVEIEKLERAVANEQCIKEEYHATMVEYRNKYLNGESFKDGRVQEVEARLREQIRAELAKEWDVQRDEMLATIKTIEKAADRRVREETGKAKIAAEKHYQELLKQFNDVTGQAAQLQKQVLEAKSVGNGAHVIFQQGIKALKLFLDSMEPSLNAISSLDTELAIKMRKNRDGFRQYIVTELEKHVDELAVRLGKEPAKEAEPAAKSVAFNI